MLLTLRGPLDGLVGTLGHGLLSILERKSNKEQGISDNWVARENIHVRCSHAREVLNIFLTYQVIVFVVGVRMDRLSGLPDNQGQKSGK